MDVNQLKNLKRTRKKETNRYMDKREYTHYQHEVDKCVAFLKKNGIILYELSELDVYYAFGTSFTIYKSGRVDIQNETLDKTFKEANFFKLINFLMEVGLLFTVDSTSMR